MNEVKPRVLIVEDDPIIASDIKIHLTNKGYQVIAIVSHGFEAVEVAKDEKPDLVLLDIMLKGYMNGIEAAEIISKKLKIPVIFLTALTDDETFLSARDTKPFAYISKPFNVEHLEKEINSALKNGKK